MAYNKKLCSTTTIHSLHTTRHRLHTKICIVFTQGHNKIGSDQQRMTLEEEGRCDCDDGVIHGGITLHIVTYKLLCCGLIIIVHR
jgi:hypothetical protein